MKNVLYKILIFLLEKLNYFYIFSQLICINILTTSISVFKSLICFFIKLVSLFISENPLYVSGNSLDVDMSGDSNGRGVSAGKAFSNGSSISPGNVISSFYTTKYEFFSLCGSFSGLMALMRLFMCSSNCFFLIDATLFKV